MTMRRVNLSGLLAAGAGPPTYKVNNGIASSQ